jgi:hypothetical protein
MKLMSKTDIFLKVVVEHDDEDTPEKLAAEICRQIEKIYAVRSAEMSNFVTRRD